MIWLTYPQNYEKYRIYLWVNSVSCPILPPPSQKKKPSNDNPYHSNDDQDMKFLNISMKLR